MLGNPIPWGAKANVVLDARRLPGPNLGCLGFRVKNLKHMFQPQHNVFQLALSEAGSVAVTTIYVTGMHVMSPRRVPQVCMQSLEPYPNRKGWSLRLSILGAEVFRRYASPPATQFGV